MHFDGTLFLKYITLMIIFYDGRKSRLFLASDIYETGDFG